MRGWHVVVGYVLGFLVMLLVLGWHPPAVKVVAEPAPMQGVEVPSRPVR